MTGSVDHMNGRVSRAAAAAIAMLLATAAGRADAVGVDPASIEPRRPELPPAGEAEGEHPIDRLLAPYFEEHGVEPGPLVSDRVFARRAYLDLVGLLPTPRQLRAFEEDAAPGKRRRLVRELLDSRRAYAEHWLTFWNDMLRNAYRGAGFIDGGRKQITGWLYRSLYENKPYDAFVRELVDPVEGSAGFVKGIKWRGVVNASQRPQMQAAQTIGQVLLGENLKCASCHDSFIDDWKLSDAYALAAVFADEPLQVHRCDRPTGETAEPGFLYPQLGAIDAEAPREARQARLAALLTDERNGRLTRTIVNRLWAALMGRGLVEPVDRMSAEPWRRDLLDWLAADLGASGYDLKHTLETLCTSRAYQLPSVPAPEPDEAGRFVFRGPLVKRMTAEQFVDAVRRVTGVWPDVTEPMIERDGRGQGGQLTAVSGAIGMDAQRYADPDRRPGVIGAVGVRAALADADELMRALGRPNREQVVTRRDSVATTLQALELTNGATLDALLRRGAANRLQSYAGAAEGGDELVGDLYEAALGRRPNEDERHAARRLIGDPPTVDGVADLLWALTMLPEFQLIH